MASRRYTTKAERQKVKHLQGVEKAHARQHAIDQRVSAMLKHIEEAQRVSPHGLGQIAEQAMNDLIEEVRELSQDGLAYMPRRAGTVH